MDCPRSAANSSCKGANLIIAIETQRNKSHSSYISLISFSGPSITPLTVSSRVFMHQPFNANSVALFWVCFRKKTPGKDRQLIKTKPYRVFFSFATHPGQSQTPQSHTNTTDGSWCCYQVVSPGTAGRCLSRLNKL